MKNIHVIPTDKPSKLYKCRFKGHFILNPMTDLEGCFEEGFDPQNISVTNSEKIKEGDWYIADNKLYRASVDHMPELYTYPCKKIILTTDLELQKDGVQAIPIEFLEWFVKNPSCEEVKINHERVLWEDGRITHYKYKIIIPKEEPKQGTMSEAIKQVITNQLKQETLEEFCIEFVKKHFEDERTYNPSSIITAMKVSAKWQQERMYSEEEVYKLTLEALDLGMRIRQDQLCGYSEKSGKELHKEWFEQFKKK